MAAAREMLRHGRERAEALSDDPVAQAQMLHAPGRAYHNLQEYNEAGLLLSRAFAIRDSLYSDGHSDLVRTGYRLAETLGRLMLSDSAYRVIQSAADMASTQFDDRDPMVADLHLELARHAMSRRSYDQAEQHPAAGPSHLGSATNLSPPQTARP